MTTKITKRDYMNCLKSIVESGSITVEDPFTEEGLLNFIDHEIELLDNKAQAAAKRAADKKEAGDELREKIFNVLTDEPATIDDIVALVDDPDITRNKVASRLGQLVKMERVERSEVTLETPSGKTRKAAAYRLASN